MLSYCEIAALTDWVLRAVEDGREPETIVANLQHAFERGLDTFATSSATRGSMRESWTSASTRPTGLTTSRRGPFVREEASQIDIGAVVFR